MSASILRHRHERNYTVLPNTSIRDERLSLRATGLLAYLVSLPTGSPVGSLELSKRKKEGRDAIQTAFRELANAGYVRRWKEQQAETGQWASVIEVSDSPEPDTQAPGTRLLETRLPENQALREKEQEKVTSPHRPPRGGDDDEEFVAFWNICPRKVGKGQARRAWRKALKLRSGPELIESMERFSETMKRMGTEQTYIPHPSSWLNGERWEDAFIPEPGAVADHPPAPRCGRCDNLRWVYPDEDDDGVNEVVPCPDCREA